jgi:glyoxylase-like metal-dependent hydrolase (beta-lactamase superfamily II)
VPALVHGDDRYRLRDPLGSLDQQLVAMLAAQFGRRSSWAEPDDVRSLVDGEVLTVAGLQVTVTHAPGHTEGSAMFGLPAAPDGVDAGSTVITGDVLFAGSIGRTDLPGGDHAAMLASLRDKVLPLPDDAYVLPGHGPSTTIGQERNSNPFLRQVIAERVRPSAVTAVDI